MACCLSSWAAARCLLTEDDVPPWARVGDATPIPGPKLTEAPGGVGGDDEVARVAAMGAATAAAAAQAEIDALEAVVATLTAVVTAHRQLPVGGEDGEVVGSVGGNPTWVDAPAGTSGGGPSYIGGVVLVGHVNPEDDAFDVNAYDNLMLHVNVDVTRPDIDWDAHLDTTIRKERLPLASIDAISEGGDARVVAGLSLSGTGHLIVALSASGGLTITGARVDVWGF